MQSRLCLKWQPGALREADQGVAGRSRYSDYRRTSAMLHDADLAVQRIAGPAEALKKPRCSCAAQYRG